MHYQELISMLSLIVICEIRYLGFISDMVYPIHIHTTFFNGADMNIHIYQNTDTILNMDWIICVSLLP